MTAPRPSGSRAVLFGAHAFDGFPALGGVERNVPALLALLTAPDVGGLAEDDCRVLPADSRADDVLDAVADAAGEAEDLLLVYYAGHGHHTDEGLLLATRKADLDRPHHFVDYARVRDFVAGSRARHKVVIVDCCYAGGALHMGEEAPPIPERALAFDGGCVLASAAATERSLCRPDGSVFTMELVRLLRDGLTGPLRGGRRGEEQRHLLAADLFDALRQGLKGLKVDGWPVPQPRMATLDGGHDIPLALNRAFKQEAGPSGAAPKRQPQPAPDPLAAVVGQRTFVDGLGGFRRNLTPEQLPFVSPGSTHPAAPETLFRRLRDTDERGVLLVGTAGTGKTRTGLEVGRIALDEGWRVLHVRPGRESTITGQISSLVLAEDSPVLVVIDYLNEHLEDDDNDAQLDLTALRHRLLPEARRKDIKVAFLASVRPGWLQKAAHIPLHDLFDKVDLRQDEEFQRVVAEHALASLAPTAIDSLGMDRMRAICGHRPIIALLLARELERRAAAGLLDSGNAGLRAGGDLARWLRDRLMEDDLAVRRLPDERRRTAFDQVTASDDLVAAAAAAAACPQEHAEVIAAAAAALSGTPSGSLHAEVVVDTLIDLGWLERDGDGDVLSTAHDIVCDQLVESVILPAHSRIPHRARTRTLLDGSLTSPRTIGRYATNLARLMNDLALDQRAEAVSAVLDTWFADNATAIGEVMRADADIGGYALGALCSGQPWAHSVVRNWQRLVGPWLEEFGDGVNARHVLYRGLWNLPTDGGALLLVPAALRWLESHGRRREASFVLGPLLSRTDIPAEQQKPALRDAITWLRRHGEVLEAHFVLRALVGRADLTPQQVRQVVAEALRWSERDTTLRQVAQILTPLLARTDLTGDELRRVVLLALEWLRHHRSLWEPHNVLRSLLTRRDLTENEARQAASFSFRWLKQHAAAPPATFVLRPLLARTELARSQVRRAVDFAAQWLEEHAVRPEADFLVRQMLGRTDLTEDESRRAAGFAVRWLEQHATTPEADFLIRQMLARPDLTADESRRAAGFAVQWLALHAGAPEASFALGALLARADLTDEQAEQAVTAAMTWLDRHAGTDAAGYVLSGVLGRGDLPEYEAGGVHALACAWLAPRTGSPEANFTLSKLLSRSDLDGERARQAIGSAERWLSRHGDSDAAEYVLRALLSRPDLTAGQTGDAVTRATHWMRRYGTARNAGYVLGPLLGHGGLTAAQAGEAVTAALSWLAHHGHVPEAEPVLASLLGRGDLSRGEREQAAAFATQRGQQNGATYREAKTLSRRLAARPGFGAEQGREDLASALAWLERHPDLPEAAQVFRAVFVHHELTGDELRRTVTAATTWLEHHVTRTAASYLLQPLLELRGLPDDATGPVAAHALEWLAHHRESAQASYTLGALIASRRITARTLDRGIALAADWLQQNVTSPGASFVLDKLLARGEITGDRARAAVAFTEVWLERHVSMRAARFVLEPLLARSDLTPDETRLAVTHATRWLREFGSLHEARHVLVAVNAHAGLGPAEIGHAFDATVTWLERHDGPANAQTVLAPLFARADLGPEQLRQFAGFTLGRLSDYAAPDSWRVLGLLVERTDLPPDQAREVVSRVVSGLQPDPAAYDASFLLAPFLGRPDLTAARRATAVSWALSWLEQYMPVWRSRFVLAALLSLTGLPPAEVRRVVAWTLGWLDQHADGTADGFVTAGAEAVLGPLLARPDLDADETRRARTHLPAQAPPKVPGGV
ncbi:caspase, EACC1-associated type [Streptomyces sp. NPDC002386]